jgi:hypothetical protein
MPVSDIENTIAADEVDPEATIPSVFKTEEGERFCDLLNTWTELMAYGSVYSPSLMK